MRSPHSFSAGKALRMSGRRRSNKTGEDEENTHDFGSLRFTLWVLPIRKTSLKMLVKISF
jgi:hypothetical protein